MESMHGKHARSVSEPEEGLFMCVEMHACILLAKIVFIVLCRIMLHLSVQVTMFDPQIWCVVMTTHPSP